LAAEGNRPVNALDLALRKDLGAYQKYIENLELIDYRVRVFQGGATSDPRADRIRRQERRNLVGGRRRGAVGALIAALPAPCRRPSAR
jgi:hypothetical protein